MPEPPLAVVSSPADAGEARKLWPELESYPVIEATRVVALPTQPDVPRFDVGGPAVLGDVAVVSSSQSGFVAVDWRRGAVIWSKPAELRVATQLEIDGLRPGDVAGIVLVR